MTRFKCRSGQTRCILHGLVKVPLLFSLMVTLRLRLVGGDRYPSVPPAEWPYAIPYPSMNTLPYVKYTNRRRWVCVPGNIICIMKEKMQDANQLPVPWIVNPPCWVHLAEMRDKRSRRGLFHPSSQLSPCPFHRALSPKKTRLSSLAVTSVEQDRSTTGFVDICLPLIDGHARRIVSPLALCHSLDLVRPWWR
jgi:hypothetical protein